MPTLELPLATNDTPREPIFRALIIEPVDRITIYLINTSALPQTAPNVFSLELRIGSVCIEETAAIATPVTPKFSNDGGHLLTFASEQLFNSIVITGNTIQSAIAPVVGTSRVQLQIRLDRIGMCCTTNPVYGPLVKG